MWDFEIIGNTLVHVEVEELIGTLADMLQEANATKIGDTVNIVESKTLVDTLAETLRHTELSSGPGTGGQHG